MADTSQRTILHVDMDAFFAAVELQRYPHLTGEAVIVGGRGDPARRGVVSTATYEARRYGVHSGMALRTAARLCPHAHFLPVDLARYREVSVTVFGLLREMTSKIQGVGLDEAYLDLTDHRRPGRDAAAELKRRITQVTGLTASVGVAPNRLLAKIASDLEKPDGLCVLGYEDVPARVWPLPVRTLHGVGPRTEERLNAAGIHTVGDLAHADGNTLGGGGAGRHVAALQRAAHGEDERPVVVSRERKSIGRERTFQRDCQSSGRLAADTQQLLEDVLARLHSKELAARTVTVKIRYRDFVTQTRSVSLPSPTTEPELLQAAAREALFKHRLHRAVRLLGVQVSQLIPDPTAG
jgi:DNA polymerase-4